MDFPLETEEVVTKTYQISEIDSNRYIAAPTISSLTLVSNWDELAEASLKDAVYKVVNLNPILTGSLVKDAEKNKLTVVSQTHSSFFNVIDGPKSFSLPKDVYGRIVAIHTYVEPLFEILGLPIEQITTGSRLFSVSVCTLPDSHACYIIQLSHMIADGATYYMLLRQLQDFLEGKDASIIPQYKWIPSPDNILTSSFYTEEDIERELNSWRPAFMNLALNQPPRKSSIEMIDTTKLSSYKPGLVLAAARAQMPVGFLSTNDFITAALAEVLDTDLVEMMANMRGRIDGVTSDIAANAERGIFFPRRLAASSPEYVRSKLMKHFCAWSDSHHMSAYNYAFLESDFSIITNWCALVTFVHPKGTEILVHAPASAFVKADPINACIIFKADRKGTIAINHNIRRDTENFKKRYDNSILFKNIIDYDLPTTSPIHDDQSNWIHVKKWIAKLRIINRWRSQAWGITNNNNNETK